MIENTSLQHNIINCSPNCSLQNDHAVVDKENLNSRYNYSLILDLLTTPHSPHQQTETEFAADVQTFHDS